MGALVGSVISAVISFLAIWKAVIIAATVTSAVVFAALTRTVNVEVDVEKTFKTAISRQLAKDHHGVHAKVGEEKWELDAKADIIFEVTRMSVFGTGKLVPTAEDIALWSENNQQTIIEIINTITSKYSKEK